MRTTTIQKWGNSYAVRIPMNVVESLKLKAGQIVRVEEAGRGLAITPAAQSDLSLAQLVAKITPKNRYKEFDWGPAVGREVW